MTQIFETALLMMAAGALVFFVMHRRARKSS